MDFYRSNHWPTRDHVIPFKLFALFENAIVNVAAAERLSMVQAFAHGQAVAMAGKAVEKQTRDLANLACPEVLITDAEEA